MSAPEYADFTLCEHTDAKKAGSALVSFLYARPGAGAVYGRSACPKGGITPGGQVQLVGFCLFEVCIGVF